MRNTIIVTTIVTILLMLMASAVQASLYLTVDGERMEWPPPPLLVSGCRLLPLEMTVGESVTIGVWNDDDAMTWEVNWLTIPYRMGVKPLSEFAEPIIFPAAGDMASIQGPYSSIEPLARLWPNYRFAGWQLETRGYMEGVYNTIVAGLQFESEFTYLDEGDLRIMLIGRYSSSLPYAVRDSITITKVVPEPTTVMLLGLGSLILLRKGKSNDNL